MEKLFTQYSLIDGKNLKTTIKLPKLMSDMISSHVDDMHAWLLSYYLAVDKKHPNLSRRMKGNLVRQMVLKKCVDLGGFSDMF